MRIIYVESEKCRYQYRVNFEQESVDRKRNSQLLPLTSTERALYVWLSQ